MTHVGVTATPVLPKDGTLAGWPSSSSGATRTHVHTQMQLRDRSHSAARRRSHNSADSSNSLVSLSVDCPAQ